MRPDPAMGITDVVSHSSSLTNQDVRVLSSHTPRNIYLFIYIQLLADSAESMKARDTSDVGYSSCLRDIYKRVQTAIGGLYIVDNSP